MIFKSKLSFTPISHTAKELGANMLNKLISKFIILSIILTLGLPQTVFAYIGPGTGLSAIGSFLAVLVGIIVAFLGFLWYPIKRLFGKKKSQEPNQINIEEE